jgi:hypothetical protein
MTPPGSWQTRARSRVASSAAVRVNERLVSSEHDTTRSAMRRGVSASHTARLSSFDVRWAPCICVQTHASPSVQRAM